MRISYSASSFLVSALSFGGGVVFYAGMRISSLPASYLSLILAPIGLALLVVLIAAKKVKKNELTFLFAIQLLLLATGAFVYTPQGVSFSLGGIAAALVMISAYLMARALTIFHLAYYFTAAAFWIVAVPALWILMQESSSELKNFFMSSSENAVSAWLIFTSSAMAVVKYQRWKRYSVVPLLISFVVAYFLFTRASIAVAFLAIVFMVYARFGFNRAFFFTLLAGGIISVFGLSMYFDSLINQTKFGARGLDSARWMMWQAYFREINGVSFLLGADVSFIPEIQQFSNNPHSSFIRFHAIFGSIPLALGVLLVYVFFRRVRFFCFCMFFIILMRASTDTLLFGVFYDVFLMIVVVTAFQKNISSTETNDIWSKRIKR